MISRKCKIIETLNTERIALLVTLILFLNLFNIINNREQVRTEYINMCEKTIYAF